jgi:hypothetical protein
MSTKVSIAGDGSSSERNMSQNRVRSKKSTKQLHRQQKKRPALKNQLAVHQSKTKGAKRSVKPASTATGNAIPLVQTLKVPSQAVPAVDKYEYKIKIGDCEYPCQYPDWAKQDPSPLPAGKYLTCLVDVRASPACGTISMVFINLDGPHKGLLLSMSSRISPETEFAQTRKLLSEAGLLSDVKEAMAGEVKRFATDGIVCLCNVATICYEDEDWIEVEENEIRSVEVVRIVRSEEDISH